MKTGRFHAVVSLAAAAFLSLLPGTSTAFPLDGGPELQVNLQTSGMQRLPSIASDGAGNFMVVWSSDFSSPEPGLFVPGIFGRLYRTSSHPSNAVTPQTAEIRIGDSLTDRPVRPRVASDGPRRFLVVWEQQGKILGRRFDATGQPRSGEIRIDASGTAGSPALAAIPGGGFVVVWKQANGIRARLLDSEANPVRSEVGITPSLSVPEVAVSPLGGFVVAWSLADAGLTFREIMARLFDGEGNPRGQAFSVNTLTAYDLGSEVDPVPLFHRDGGFSIVWQSRSSSYPGVFARRYTTAGQPEERVHELDRRAVPLGAAPPAVALDPAGQILVLWNGVAQEDEDGLYAGLFSPFWEPVQETFLVNTYEPDSQTEPAVAATLSGDFMAVWGSGGEVPPVLPFHLHTQDGHAFGVFARFFSSGECPPDETHLCLQRGRFQLQVSWTDHDGNSGEGRAHPITDDTGAFSFFNPDNLELMVKVLDGRAVNGHFWVFYGALSDVEYTLTVIDTQDGERRTYHNPARRLASRADTEAFLDPLSPTGTASVAGISAAATLPGSPEFQVNVNTQGVQRHPSLAINGAGDVLVVWSSAHEGSWSLYGRIYDSLGNPRTGEFLVAEPKPQSSYLFNSKAAANRAGEFVVVWNENGVQNAGAVARRFGANGQPLGNEIRLNAATSSAGPPDIARRPQGGFVAVWADEDGVRARFLDDQGNPAGSEIEVARATYDIGEPRVSVSSAGSFVVTWDTGSTASDNDIWARRFGADGTPQGLPILVNGVEPYQTGHQSGAVPVAFPDGSFTVFWQAPFYFREGLFGVFSRFFPAGLPPGEIQSLNSPGTVPDLAPLTLAMDGLGQILLLWSGSGPADDSGTFGRIVSPNGLPKGDIFLMNVFKGEAQTEPAVAASPTGGFVAVWSSGRDYPDYTPTGNEGLASQDGNFFGVFGRRFTALCGDETSLCLGERFRVTVAWTDHGGNSGAGHAVPLTTDTGAFWFFGEDNLELMIKVLDGRPVNGHFWVFYGALSDVRYTLTVTDLVTGATKTYINPARQIASRADTEAFRVE
jgi:hypothetical protein